MRATCRAIGVAGMTGALLLAARSASAQAFVPPKGEVTVTVYAQQTLVTRHMFATRWTDSGHIRTRALAVDFSVGVGRGVAFSMALPYVTARYVGAFPHALAPGEDVLHPGFQTVDDGAYHGTPADFRFDLRFNATTLHGIMVTPFVSAVVPSHDYEYLGHAIVGRNTREVHVGAFAAKVIPPWWRLPSGFVQGRYSVGFEQRILDIARYRHAFEVEGGYFLTSKFRALALMSAVATRGGVDSIAGPRADFPAPSPLFVHHDQIQHERILNVGGGGAYELTPKIGLFGSVLRTVAGINGHALAYSATLGMSYTFAIGEKARAAAGMTAMCHEDNGLAKCVCLRK